MTGTHCHGNFTTSSISLSRRQNILELMRLILYFYLLYLIIDVLYHSTRVVFNTISIVALFNYPFYSLKDLSKQNFVHVFENIRADNTEQPCWRTQGKPKYSPNLCNIVQLSLERVLPTSSRGVPWPSCVQGLQVGIKPVDRRVGSLKSGQPNAA